MKGEIGEFGCREIKSKEAMFCQGKANTNDLQMWRNIIIVKDELLAHCGDVNTTE